MDLLTTLFLLYITHVSQRKLLCYNDKSLKFVYLLMLVVVPHTSQIVTDLRSVKAEQGQHDFTVKDQQFIHHVNAQTTRKSC